MARSPMRSLLVLGVVLLALLNVVTSYHADEYEMPSSAHDQNTPQMAFMAKMMRQEHFNRMTRNDPSNRHKFCFFCIKNPSFCDPLRACQYNGGKADGASQ